MERKITRVRVRLKKPHTHEGRDYEPPAVLWMDSDSADWLTAIDSAEKAPPNAAALNEPPAEPAPAA